MAYAQAVKDTTAEYKMILPIKNRKAKKCLQFILQVCTFSNYITDIPGKIMNEKDKKLMIELKKRIFLHKEKHLKQLIVFGSRARNNNDEDSDIDVIALIEQKTPEAEEKLEDIVYELMWENDFKPFISLKVFSESQFNNAVEMGFSFYKNVKREGLLI